MMQDLPPPSPGPPAFLRGGGEPHPHASITANPGAGKELPMTWEQGGQGGKCEKARGKMVNSEEDKEMSIVSDLEGLTVHLHSMTHIQTDSTARLHIIKYQINNSMTGADLKKE